MGYKNTSRVKPGTLKLAEVRTFTEVYRKYVALENYSVWPTWYGPMIVNFFVLVWCTDWNYVFETGKL